MTKPKKRSMHADVDYIKTVFEYVKGSRGECVLGSNNSIVNITNWFYPLEGSALNVFEIFWIFDKIWAVDHNAGREC